MGGPWQGCYRGSGVSGQQGTEGPSVHSFTRWRIWANLGKSAPHAGRSVGWREQRGGAGRPSRRVSRRARPSHGGGTSPHRSYVSGPSNPSHRPSARGDFRHGPLAPSHSPGQVGRNWKNRSTFSHRNLPGDQTLSGCVSVDTVSGKQRDRSSPRSFLEGERHRDVRVESAAGGGEVNQRRAARVPGAVHVLVPSTASGHCSHGLSV